MWALDEDGDMVNLDHCLCVVLRESDAAKWTVTALRREGDGTVLRYCLCSGSEALCRDSMGRLARQLSALKAGL